MVLWGKAVLGLSVSIMLWFFCLFPAYSQEPNYCDDKPSWQEWDALVAKYPHDMDIQMLHAVRIGFCKKIEDGSIKFEAARDAFNSLHRTVIKRAEAAKEQWLRSKQL